MSSRTLNTKSTRQHSTRKNRKGNTASVSNNQLLMTIYANNRLQFQEQDLPRLPLTDKRNTNVEYMVESTEVAAQKNERFFSFSNIFNAIATSVSNAFQYMVRFVS